MTMSRSRASPSPRSGARIAVVRALLLTCLGAGSSFAVEPVVGTMDPAHAENVIVRGGTRHEMLTGTMGSLTSSWHALTLPSQDASLTCTLPVPGASTTPVLVEIEEIHQRREQAFGYAVEVAGTPVYFRSYTEMGAGPVRYFVQIPRQFVTKDSITITLRNVGPTPVSIGRLWAYDHFFALADQEGTYEPMPVFQEASTLVGTLAPKGAEVAWNAAQKTIGTPADDQTWETLRHQLEGTGYTGGPFVNLQYALSSFGDTKSIIDGALPRIAHLGMPFQLAFNSGEWGSHPNGMDGLGGFFSDVTYSTIAYDPQKKSYRPCWPGTPGNTTWPAWNDPQLQRFLDFRLRQAVNYYELKRDLMAARGTPLPFPPIDQDWGLATSADCSDSTVAAAQRDGLHLTQEDGLDDEEKQWKYRNMSQIPQRFGRSFAEAVQGGTTVVDRGTVTMPDHQTLDDYYFQTFADASNSPYLRDQWAGWQYAAGEQTWATGEFLPHLPEPYFDYIRGQGKLMCPNMERMALPTLEYIHVCYERGFRGVWICNARSGDAELYAPQAKGQDNRPCRPAITANRSLLHLPFHTMTSLGSDDHLVRQDNCANPVLPSPIPAQGSLARGLQTVNAGQPGTIVYRIHDGDRPLTHELELDLTAQFAPNSNAIIDIALGTSAETLTTVRHLTPDDFPAMNTYPWTRKAHVRLGTSLVGAKVGVVALTLHAPAGPASVIIDTLNLTQAWPTASGHPGGEPFTVRNMRTMNLWCQNRAVLERLQRRYLQRGTRSDTAYQAACAAQDRGHLSEAYRILSRAISQFLPARYAVRGQGPLGNLGITAQLEHDQRAARVTVLRRERDEVEVRLESDEAQSVELTLLQMPQDARYAAERSGPATWRIHRTTETSGTAPQQGAVSFRLPIAPESDAAPTLPPRLVGSVVAQDQRGLWIDTQAEGLWMENPICVPVDAKTVYSRSPDGGTNAAKAEKPRYRDTVTLTISANGIAHDVQATYGVAKGTIATFEPPVLKGTPHNGIITLQDGSRYEFANMWGYTNIDVPRLKMMIRYHTADDLIAALKPGLAVEITYCPSPSKDRLPRMWSLVSKRPPKDPNLAPAVVIGEGLSDGWIANGWSSTMEPRQSGTAHTGTLAYAITMTAAGGGAGVFRHPAAFDCTPYGKLSFAIHGGTTGGQRLALVCYEGGKPYLLPAPLAANTWTTYSVSLADLGATEMDTLQAIRFVDQEGTSVGKTFYVDDLTFVP